MVSIQDVALALVSLKQKCICNLLHTLGHPLYQIYMDLTKAYDTLDHAHTLSLLKAYGIGPHTCSVIEEKWEWETIVPKSGDCFSIHFSAHRGI